MGVLHVAAAGWSSVGSNLALALEAHRAGIEVRRTKTLWLTLDNTCSPFNAHKVARGMQGAMGVPACSGPKNERRDSSTMHGCQKGPHPGIEDWSVRMGRPQVMQNDRKRLVHWSDVRELQRSDQSMPTLRAREIHLTAPGCNHPQGGWRRCEQMVDGVP